MISQYIYGRTQGGYGKIKASPGFSGDPHRNCNNINYSVSPGRTFDAQSAPSPLVFLPEVAGMSGGVASVVMRSARVPAERDSNIEHYYIFDGSDRQSLLDDPDSIFRIKQFVGTSDEGSKADLPSSDIFLPKHALAQLGEFAEGEGIDGEKAATLVYSAFAAVAEPKCRLYAVLRETSNNEMERCAPLLRLIFRYIPQSLLRQFGFLTFDEHINRPSILNAGIKAVFASETNRPAKLNDYGAIESGGARVYDFASGYCTPMPSALADEPFTQLLAGVFGGLADYAELRDFYSWYDKAFQFPAGTIQKDFMSYGALCALYRLYWRGARPANGAAPLPGGELTRVGAELLLKYEQRLADSVKLLLAQETARVICDTRLAGQPPAYYVSLLTPAVNAFQSTHDDILNYIAAQLAYDFEAIWGTDAFQASIINSPLKDGVVKALLDGYQYDGASGASSSNGATLYIKRELWGAENAARAGNSSGHAAILSKVLSAVKALTRQSASTLRIIKDCDMLELYLSNLPFTPNAIGLKQCVECSMGFMDAVFGDGKTDEGLEKYYSSFFHDLWRNGFKAFIDSYLSGKLPLSAADAHSAAEAMLVERRPNASKQRGAARHWNIIEYSDVEDGLLNFAERYFGQWGGEVPIAQKIQELPNFFDFAMGSQTAEHSGNIGRQRLERLINSFAISTAQRVPQGMAKLADWPDEMLNRISDNRVRNSIIAEQLAKRFSDALDRGNWQAILEGGLASNIAQNMQNNPNMKNWLGNRINKYQANVAPLPGEFWKMAVLLFCPGDGIKKVFERLPDKCNLKDIAAPLRALLEVNPDAAFGAAQANGENSVHSLACQIISERLEFDCSSKKYLNAYIELGVQEQAALAQFGLRPPAMGYQDDGEQRPLLALLASILDYGAFLAAFALFTFLQCFANSAIKQSSIATSVSVTLLALFALIAANQIWLSVCRKQSRAALASGIAGVLLFVLTDMALMADTYTFAKPLESAYAALYAVDAGNAADDGATARSAADDSAAEVSESLGQAGYAAIVGASGNETTATAQEEEPKTQTSATEEPEFQVDISGVINHGATTGTPIRFDPDSGEMTVTVQDIDESIQIHVEVEGSASYAKFSLNGSDLRESTSGFKTDYAKNIDIGVSQLFSSAPGQTTRNIFEIAVRGELPGQMRKYTIAIYYLVSDV
jgi:hypothetical protein